MNREKKYYPVIILIILAILLPGCSAPVKKPPRPVPVDSLKQAKSPIDTADSLKQAKFLIDGREIDKATDLLRNIIKDNPDSLPAYDMLSEVLVVRRRMDILKKYLDRVLASHPDHTPAVRALVLYHLWKYDEDSAFKAAGKAVRLAPKDPLNHVILGRVQWQNRDWDESRESYNKALSLDPDNLEALARLFILEIDVCDFSASEKVLSRMKDYKGLRMDTLSDFLDSMADLEIMYRGNTEEGVKYYEEAVRLDPMDAYSISRVGLLRAELGDLEIAKDAAEKALKMSPDNVHSHTAIAAVRTIQGRYTGALEALRIASKDEDDHLDALIMEGDLLYTLNRFRDAHKVFERLAKMNPQEIEGNLGMARCALGMGDEKKADEYYSKVYYWPKNKTGQKDFDRGVVLTEVFREYDRAKPHLLKAEKVIIDAEMKKECYAALARIAMHEGDVDGLDRYLEKAEENDPGFLKWMPALRAARVGLEEGKTKLTSRLLNRVEKYIGSLTPVKQEASYFTAARYLISHGHADAGLPYLEKAMKMNPDVGEYHIIMGRALMLKGKKDEAKDEFEEAKRLEPENIELEKEIEEILGGKG